MKNFEFSAGHVYYRGAGERYMLLWKTHDEGCHAIVAHSQHALSVAFDRVHAEHGIEISIESVAKIRLVAPPADMVEAAVASLYAEAVSSFKRQVVGSLVRTGRYFMPWPFRKCPRFKRDKRIGGHNQHSHSGCANCIDTYMLTSMTDAEFFDRYAFQWHTTIEPLWELPYSAWSFRDGDPRPGPTLASCDTSGSQVMALATSFGDHRHGVSSVCCTADVLMQPVLFTYTVCADGDNAANNLLLEGEYRTRVEKRRDDNIALVKQRVAAHAEERAAKNDAAHTAFCKNVIEIFAAR